MDIGQILGLIARAPYVISAWLEPRLKAEYGEDVWKDGIWPALNTLQREKAVEACGRLQNLDFGALVSIFTYRGNWKRLLKQGDVPSHLYDLAKRTRAVRNKYSHVTASTNPSEGELWADYAVLKRFLSGLGAPSAMFVDDPAQATPSSTEPAVSRLAYDEIRRTYDDKVMSLKDKVFVFGKILYVLVWEAVKADPSLNGLAQSEAKVRMRPLIIKLFESDRELHTNVVDLQRLTIRLKNAEEGLLVSQTDYQESFATICRVVSHLLDVDIPEDLAAICGRITYRRRRDDERNSLELKCIRAFVERVESPYLYVKRELAAEDESELRFNYVASGECYAHLEKLVEQGMLVAFVTPARRDADWVASEIILEPDLLFSPSSIGQSATAGSHRGLYYVINGLKESSIPPRYALRGNVVSQALADVCAGGETSDDALIGDYFSKKPLDCLGQIDAVWGAEARNGCEKVREFIRGPFRKACLGTDDDWIRKVMVEAPFVSPVYGLTGRADALRYDSPTAVLELKSGRWDVYNQTWQKTHECQPLFYGDVLFSSLGIDFRNETSYLYYSSLNGHDFIIPHQKEKIQWWTMIRNAIVSLLTRMAKGGFTEDLADLNASDFRFKRYGRDQHAGDDELSVRAFLETVRQASPIAKAYFNRFIAFAAAEDFAACIGERGDDESRSGESVAWRTGVTERRKTGRAFVGCPSEVRIEYGMVRGLTLKCGTDGGASVCSIRKGDGVFFYEVKDERSSIVNSILFRGTVSDIGDGSMTIDLVDPQHEELLAFAGRESEHRIAVESQVRGCTLGSGGSYYRGAYALLAGNARRRDLVLMRTAPESDATVGLAVEPNNRYERISDILLRIWQARDFYLVWGVPGSGKTTYLMRAIVDQVMAGQGSVLLLAYTNRAADEICRMLDARMREGFPSDDYMRLGRRERCEIGRGHFPEDFAFHDDEEVHARLERIRIVVGTISSLSPSHPIFRHKDFELAVVDEASQLLEPHLLPLFCAEKAGTNDPLIGKFVFIGDDRQLPAVVQQEEETSAVQESELREIGLTNCRNSLFERFKRRYGGDPGICGMLHAQFRMHRMISDFVNEYYYGGNLTIGGALHQDEDAPLPNGGADEFERYVLSRHVGFFPVHAVREDLEARANRAEAEVCARIVKAEVRGGRTAEDIGIIVPLKNQIAMLRQRLATHLEGVMSDSDVRSILIDTVERFEGSERKVIVFSTVIDSMWQRRLLSATAYEDDDDGDPDNAPVDRKLNVAVTRAREQFFLVGDEDVLRNLRAYGELVRYIRGRSGAFGGV